jgi:hypothetical protein
MFEMRFLCRIIESILRICRDRIPGSNQFAPSPDVLKIIEKAVEVLTKEDAVLKLSGSFVIVGDIHGNLDALIRIFDDFGYPNSCRFVFLGDYVDRGCQSCEVIILLYVLKILFPNNIFLLRGSRCVTAWTSTAGYPNSCRFVFLEMNN